MFPFFSVHDALCVVRSLVKKRFMIAGGGVAETELAVKLSEWSKTLVGMKSYCVRAYAEVGKLFAMTLSMRLY